MDYADLEILGSEIRNKETILLGNLSNEELKALKKDAAKTDLKNDLTQALQMEIDDATMETFLSDNIDFLRETLSLRQLFWYFYENDGGDGSVNRKRWQYYEQRYKDNVKLFKSLLATKEIPYNIGVQIAR